ncbi:MAG TPA: hypothetical protein VKT99_18125 [Xanthobacteraceae bacterium]|jgi:hypothetical protein|nr:hypothetical protein [Xanthobacteraceae bacterium]
MFVAWRAKHELPPSPARFEPQPAEAIADNVPSAPRKTGAKPKARKALENFIVERWPDGVPPEITTKMIARRFAATEGGFSVSERTVRRALGLK